MPIYNNKRFNINLQYDIKFPSTDPRIDFKKPELTIRFILNVTIFDGKWQHAIRNRHIKIIKNKLLNPHNCTTDRLQILPSTLLYQLLEIHDYIVLYDTGIQNEIHGV